MYTYNQDLVSLVTPGWNGKNFVHRLLDSILEQTYRPIEYIYVDDGSTDGTVDIVLSYKDKFKKANIEFKFIQRENGGICEALMTGFQHVTGEYMSCPEYDDILLPYSIEEKVKYLKKHSDCAVVTADAWIVNENNLAKRDRLISNKNPNRFDRNHFYQALMSNTIFNAACHLIRTDLFDKTHSNRKIYSSRIAPNQQILLPLYYYYNRGFIDKPLSLFLERQGSVSHPNKTFDIEMQREVEYKNILFNTLENINMPSDLLNLYKNRVNINIYKDFLWFGYIYNNHKLFHESLSFLEFNNETCPEYYIWQKRLNSPLYKFKQYLKRIIRSYIHKPKNTNISH